MEPVQNYQILLNSSLIAFNLLLLETTMIFSKKPSETLKSILLTLLLKMKLMWATKLTLFPKMIQWQDVKLPNDWLLEQQNPSC